MASERALQCSNLLLLPPTLFTVQHRDPDLLLCVRLSLSLFFLLPSCYAYSMSSSFSSASCHCSS